MPTAHDTIHLFLITIRAWKYSKLSKNEYRIVTICRHKHFSNSCRIFEIVSSAPLNTIFIRKYAKFNPALPDVAIVNIKDVKLRNRERYAARAARPFRLNRYHSHSPRVMSIRTNRRFVPNAVLVLLAINNA